ncbi:MAG: histidine kinase dimerization/phosphoacceptor domain -containing protein [Polaribacter sp.]
MKKLSILLLLLFATSIYAQKNKFDSIATYYSNKAWDLYETQNDSTIYYANKGIAYSKSNGSTIGEILNLEIKGIYFEEVKNDYDKASELYFKAIEIAEKNHKKYVSSLYNNLCIMYITKKDYSKAALYGKKAVETSSYIKGTRSEAKAYVNLGIAQSLLGKFEEANHTLNFFLKLKVLSLFEQNIANLRIAKNYRLQKKYLKAQPLLLKVIKYDSLKGQRKYNLDYAELVQNLIDLKDKKNINKYLHILKNSFKEEKNLDAKTAFYETMSKASIFLNEPNKAIKYQTDLLAIKDSLNNRLNKKQILELETKYQTKKKEEQIIDEKSKRQFWLGISIIAFVILILVIVLLSKNSKKRKLLKQNKIELEKLLNQRNMLLKETHHRVKNSFQMVSSLLQLQAQGSKAESAVKALDNAVQRVNSMIVLHQQLYAKDDLLGVDLKVYINDLINEILSSYSSKNINIKSNIVSTILDIDSATSIGLLINELATNSIKYAWDKNTSEKMITLHIDVKDDEFRFKMFDNGTSIRTKNTQQNYGSELIEILIERLDAEKLESSENDFGVHLKFKK